MEEIASNQSPSPETKVNDNDIDLPTASHISGDHSIPTADLPPHSRDKELYKENDLDDNPDLSDEIYFAGEPDLLPTPSEQMVNTTSLIPCGQVGAYQELMSVINLLQTKYEFPVYMFNPPAFDD